MSEVQKPMTTIQSEKKDSQQDLTNKSESTKQNVDCETKAIQMNQQLINHEQVGKTKFDLKNLNFDDFEIENIKQKLKDIIPLTREIVDLDLEHKVKPEVRNTKINIDIQAEISSWLHEKPKLKVKKKPFVAEDSQQIDSKQIDSPFTTKDVRTEDQKKLKFRSSLEQEVTQIIILWKYIKNLVLNIKPDFDVSC